jgi:D-alanyl-D-alanine carboxypeptidase
MTLRKHIIVLNDKSLANQKKSDFRQIFLSRDARVGNSKPFGFISVRIMSVHIFDFIQYFMDQKALKKNASTKLLNAALVITITVWSYSPAHAKSTLNSMCYVQNKSGAKVQGDRTQELYEIASVSKVVTSYWAIRELGPRYRFSTQIHITPVSKDVFDVHIQGAKDPFWGRQLTHLAFEELNRIGVREIRKLSFDENFSIRWRVLSDFEETVDPSPNEIRDSLITHISKLSTEYPATWKEATGAGIPLATRVILTAQEVSFVPSIDFKPSVETHTYVLKSSPLYRYLKEMNMVSNNHVADKIYDYLGGTTTFKNFFFKDMGFDGSDLQFINGSGNSVVIRDDGNGHQVKEYNKASCDTLVKILIRFRQVLTKSYNLDLKDVMAVAKTDDSTLMPRYASIPNSMIAKTGTVDPAVTLAGVISTEHGDVYFGVLYGTDGSADWNTARDRIRDRVFNLIKENGGRKTFAYSSRPFLTFDKDSMFAPLTPMMLQKP